ncbi:unnamed protein product [Plutella xylostella]|uniref:(diamondback moth) hypothetical protein n=1 Tax=Plutella xylostella TaxID=51655 RepID=A0A8S4DS86_PLUXY|nr:unnamed protein product [Plutella xylostella]
MEDSGGTPGLLTSEISGTPPAVPGDCGVLRGAAGRPPCTLAHTQCHSATHLFIDIFNTVPYTDLISNWACCKARVCCVTS